MRPGEDSGSAPVRGRRPWRRPGRARPDPKAGKRPGRRVSARKYARGLARGVLGGAQLWFGEHEFQKFFPLVIYGDAAFGTPSGSPDRCLKLYICQCGLNLVGVSIQARFVTRKEPDPMPMRSFYNTSEAAAFLNRATSTVAAWCRAG